MNLRPILFIIFVLGFCCDAAAESLADSVRVHFRVNQTEIDSLLMGNDAAMSGFAQRMNALKDLKDSNDSKDTVIVNSILITGAASPEGSIAVNEHLSRERAAAITRWLKSYFEFPDTLPQFVFKGRDWQGLLMSVLADPAVPYKKEVVGLLYDIVGSRPVATAKRDGVARLKALRGGVSYRYLWRKHFPQLRASEIFITATVEPKIARILLSDISGQSEQSELSDYSDNSESSDYSESSESSDFSDNSDSSDPSDRPGYVFALKTNGLYGLCATPNLGVEFPIGKHFSIGADWMYAWWKNHDRNRHWRVYGGDISARWYGGTASGGRLTGHHIGLYAQVAVFQIAFGGKGYISGIPGENLWGKPWFGGGVEYGYSLQVSRRLNIDFSLGLGYMAGEYRVYRPIDDHYVWQSSHRRNWIGPTKAEISLVWLIGKMPKNVGSRPVATASKVGTHPGASAPNVGSRLVATAFEKGGGE